MIHNHALLGLPPASAIPKQGRPKPGTAEPQPDGSVLIAYPNGCAFRVDTADAEYALTRTWRINQQGYVASTQVLSKRGRRSIYLHRLLAAPPAGMQVDHVNGDPTDNRRANLRVCSIRENSRNCKAQSGRTSPFKGVAFLKRLGKWHARIQVARARIHLGLYTSETQAAAAYDAAAMHYFGAFARPNFARVSGQEVAHA